MLTQATELGPAQFYETVFTKVRSARIWKSLNPAYIQHATPGRLYRLINAL